MLLEGRDITGIPPHKICGMGIARSFQRTNIFSKLTVFENIQAAFIAHGGKGLDMWGVSERLFRDETAADDRAAALQDIAHTLAGEVSHGAQKQVELGIALAGKPRMLLLDEPTAGMCAQETHESIALLDRIAKRAGAYPAVHRARHGGRVLDRGQDRRAASGPHHRRRHAGRGARERGGAPRLPGGAQALTALLDVEGIHTAYGSSRVLFGISLDISAGECVCLLGRNGVGKTTTMRSIMGLTPPSQGRVRLQGQRHHRLGAVPAGAARHRLRAGGPAHLRRADRVGEPRRGARASADAPGAWTIDTVSSCSRSSRELRDRMGGVLSGGEQQMLTIARTLMGNPELLLLDEPSEGLAPVIVENLLRAGAAPEAARA